MASTATTPEIRPTETSMEVDSKHWMGAVGDGIVAGLAMGALMAVFMPGALDTAIPALYGQQGALVGVTAHLAHSAVLGLVFAAIVRFGNLTKYTDRVVESTGLGLAYGIVLWIVTGSIILPAWLQAVNFAGAPAVPTFTLVSLGTHAAYGIVLGALYPYFKRY